MGAWDELVSDLLEDFRVSHGEAESPNTFATSPYDKTQPATRPKAATDKTDLDKGKKRLADGKSGQEHEGDDEEREDEEREDEEREDEESTEDGARRNKRQKSVTSKENGWQKFGQELDSAGATRSELPASFQFEDTGLPFRSKS